MKLGTIGVLIQSIFLFTGVANAAGSITLKPGNSVIVGDTTVTCTGSQSGLPFCTLRPLDAGGYTPDWFIIQNGRKISYGFKVYSEAVAEFAKLKQAGVCP